MTGYLEFPAWISQTVFPGAPVRWYGLMYLVAFGVSFTLFRYEMRRTGRETDGERISDFFFWTIFGLLVGGRLLHVLAFDTSGEYLSKPWLVVWPFRDGSYTGIQGMNYYGGLVGAVIAVSVYTRVRKLDVLDWGDTLAVSAPFGYTFGRIGNFINGELTGRVSSVRWAVMFPTARRFPASEFWVTPMADQTGVQVYDPAQLVNLPRHPSQLYEALLEGIVLGALLWFVFRTRRPFKGALIALYVTGYGAARFMAEYFRETANGRGFVGGARYGTPPAALVSHPFNLTQGQLLSLALIACGLALLVVFRLIHKPPATVETFDQ